MLTVEDANEAKCERKPEMNHPALSLAFVSARNACTCVHVCACVFALTIQAAVYGVQSSV